MTDQDQKEQITDQKGEKFEHIEDIKTHLKTWNSLLLDHIRVERMGGLSNQIWKVTHKDKETKPSSIIFRKFGDGNRLVDRERENYILKGLSDAGIAPTYFGGCEEFRIEKYVDSKMLSPSDLKDKKTRRKLARLLADLHGMQFDKLEKVAAFSKHIRQDGDLIKNFQEKLEKTDFSPEEKEKIEKISSLIAEEELTFLESIAPKGQDKIVFSHNDLHSQNVVELAKDNRFMLIDYEYSDYNYRGFDIANIFNESMVTYDTKKPPHYEIDESNYPEDKCLLDFVKYYLFFVKYGKEDLDIESILKHDSYRDDYIKENHNFEQFEKEAEELLAEVKTCSIYTHYFWALWGVIMSKRGAFKFDYVDYAHSRFKLYEKVNKQFMEKGVPLEKVSDSAEA